MLETGDYVDIRFQDDPRWKKPVGIYWMQAAAVAVTSSVENRDIAPYRIPSILGAMLAAAACAWAGAAMFGQRAGFLAGAMLGASFLLSTEAGIAKTDAMLCGAVTLAMAGLARIYLASRAGEVPIRPHKLMFWLGLGLSMLIKGPIGLIVVVPAMIALSVWDRDARWLKRLGWGWGLPLVALIVGPWAIAITIATDGGFWTEAIGGDLAPKIAGGDEGHGVFPGFYLLIAPLLFFPATLLLPAALSAGWSRRGRRRWAGWSRFRRGCATPARRGRRWAGPEAWWNCARPCNCTWLARWPRRRGRRGSVRRCRPGRWWRWRRTRRWMRCWPAGAGCGWCGKWRRSMGCGPARWPPGRWRGAWWRPVSAVLRPTRGTSCGCSIASRTSRRNSCPPEPC
jgi:hypothetical protein